MCCLTSGKVYEKQTKLVYSERLDLSALLKMSLYRNMFQNGKTLPIERGLGVDQAIMKTAAERAAAGDWVHVFPEAGIGYTGTIGPLKWGIGKLICDAYRDSQPSER